MRFSGAIALSPTCSECICELPYRFQLGEGEGMGTVLANRTIRFFIPKKTIIRKPNEGQGYCQQLLEKFSKLEFFSLWLNEVLM